MVGTKKDGYNSPFDSLAAVYDAWFEEEGKLIFVIEVRALQEVLLCYPYHGLR